MPIDTVIGEGKSGPKSLVTKGKSVTEILTSNLKFNLPIYVINKKLHIEIF